MTLKPAGEKWRIIALACGMLAFVAVFAGALIFFSGMSYEGTTVNQSERYIEEEKSLSDVGNEVAAKERLSASQIQEVSSLFEAEVRAILYQRATYFSPASARLFLEDLLNKESEAESLMQSWLLSESNAERLMAHIVLLEKGEEVSNLPYFALPDATSVANDSWQERSALFGYLIANGQADKAVDLVLSWSQSLDDFSAAKLWQEFFSGQTYRSVAPVFHYLDSYRVASDDLIKHLLNENPDLPDSFVTYLANNPVGHDAKMKAIEISASIDGLNEQLGDKISSWDASLIRYNRKIVSIGSQQLLSQDYNRQISDAIELGDQDRLWRIASLVAEHPNYVLRPDVEIAILEFSRDQDPYPVVFSRTLGLIQLKSILNQK